MVKTERYLPTPKLDAPPEADEEGSATRADFGTVDFRQVRLGDRAEVQAGLIAGALLVRAKEELQFGVVDLAGRTSACTGGCTWRADRWRSQEAGSSLPFEETDASCDRESISALKKDTACDWTDFRLLGSAR